VTDYDLEFRVSDRVLDLGLQGAYFVIRNLTNRRLDATFDEMKKRVVARIRADWSKERIAKDEVLEGFRTLHESVGVGDDDTVASPEYLLQTVRRRGRLPQINLLVDIYNLVSLETRLALGAHDLRNVTGGIELRLTDGTEGYLPLGAKRPRSVPPGAYAYVDDANEILCWLEVRQVEKTKVTLDTTECFYIVQGNATTDNQYVRNGAERLIRLTSEFCGGEVYPVYPPSEDPPASNI
jgi:DNA/RNA-binding domain of Phe-tRNA-synthetase-like protein